MVRAFELLPGHARALKEGCRACVGCVTCKRESEGSEGSSSSDVIWGTHLKSVGRFFEVPFAVVVPRPDARNPTDAHATKVDHTCISQEVDVGSCPSSVVPE
eukprot:1183877-Prorocentrum_minimum.AAC.4